MLPLIALAIWSRSWIGWWSLVLLGLVLMSTVVNPAKASMPTAPPSTSRPNFRSNVPTITNGIGALGLLVLAYGLWQLEPLPVITGIVIVSCSKAWYLDRMVLLYEDMKHRDAQYARWEY